MSYPRYQSTVSATRKVVEAVHYTGENATYVREFLEHHVQSAWSGPHTSMGGGDYKTICYHYASGSTLYIAPGQIVYIDVQTHQPGMLSAKDFPLYYQALPAEPTKKEPMPTPCDLVRGYDADSEYGQNRMAVLDALALLRVNHDDTHFTLVTNELMELLAGAFNEGFSLGIETAQTNPYENWEN